MNVLHSIDELAAVPGPVFLAIGVFDGVHLGHRAVIRRAAEDAQKAGGTAVVVTFDPHPARVLRPGKSPRLLTSTAHKIRLIQTLGISHLLVIRFDENFAATKPEDFIHELHGACQPLSEICVGHEWSFGRNRAGNLKMLKQWGDKLGFEEVGVEAVTVDGEVVSSTRIRAAVEAGEMERAARFLGREFTVLGTVIEGEHLGTKLGFPTANLATHNEQFPPDGVYAVKSLLNNRTLPGVANIGIRPTVKHHGGERLLEVHLFDFAENIYGAEIEIFFRKFLRAEKKFANVDELRAQISEDAKISRTFISGTVS